MPSAGPLSISIVIPAFNEEHRIAATLEQLLEHLSQRPWDWEIRIIDDGSTDRTAALAGAFAADEPRVVVQREPHHGKGRAVKVGMLAARGDYRFLCDADLSMPISEIKWFLPPLAPDYDVAVGSREGLRARRIGEPVYRHWIGRLFNVGVQRLVLPGVEDSQCGFKMFTAAAARAVFPRVTVEGWAFDVEVLALARALGLRVVEVPIEWHYRADSRLSIPRDGLQMLYDLWRIRAKTGRSLPR
jgi:glycosyltransferase involved in cell wall biosynthesis